MKIIGVGLSKTGTSSLAAALNQLGFRCVHSWQAYAIGVQAAMVDGPAASRYRELDIMYPGSRFILTLRQREAWLESCRKHWERPGLAQEAPQVRFE
jgi:hypothetical protein